MQARSTELLDPQDLHQCQELFAAGTGLGLVLLDESGTLVAPPASQNSLAELLLPCVGSLPAFAARAAQSSSGEEGRPELVEVGPLTLLTAPLRVNGQQPLTMVGGPLLARGAPSSEEIAVLALLWGVDASSIAAAVEQAVGCPITTENATTMFGAVGRLLGNRLEEGIRIRHREAELTALTQVSAHVGSSLDPGIVIEEVLTHACALLECRQGSVMLLDDEQTSLHIAAGRGLDEDLIREVRVPLGRGIAGYVAQTGESKNLGKGFKDRYSQTEETAREVKAALCVPLIARQEVIGVLNVSDRLDDDDFSASDLDLLQTLAAQVAAAIANAELYNASEHRNEQLSALFSLGVQVSEAIDKDRDRVLQEVLDRAAELCRARKGSLMLRDEEGVHLQIVAATGLDRSIMEHVRPKIGEGIAGTVAQRGEPVVLRAGERDSRSQSRSDVDAAVCLPLRVRGETIGVLNVSDRAGGGDFSPDDVQLLSHLTRQAAIAIEKATLQAELHSMFMGTVRALANAIDARDPYTECHSERVAEFAVVMARQLGLDEEEIEAIRVAGLLHDVGKIGIREAVLGKPGKLDDEEFLEMQSHPVKGEKILRPVESSKFRRMLPWMKYHHEKFSAEGYPDGLHGEDIPLPARIIAVADTYDAMTSNRPYRKGLPHTVALTEISRCSGSQFDPKVVEAFLACDAAGVVEPIRELK
ncbi:MAG: GAF domain-containing protein [Armatimonadetes bacterium]|nr:GAF domain-containing protein [Armatimonadota bacterium]